MTTTRPALKVITPVRTRKPAAEKAPTDIVGQVKIAFQRKNLLATLLGAALGGFVPAATFAISHNEVSMAMPLWMQVKVLLVLGGLVYSAKTVYAWGCKAFQSPAKAVGFTLLMEGVMTLSSQSWLCHLALGYLVFINAVATGVTLALPKK